MVVVEERVKVEIKEVIKENIFYVLEKIIKI